MENKIVTPLSEDEKNELVVKYKNIVYSVAYRYRYLDSDIDDVRGWGFVGFTKALNRYEMERDQDFVSMLFYEVRREIYNQCWRKKVVQPASQKNMESIAFAGKDGSSKTVGDYIPDESLFLNEIDIKRLIEEALFEESDVSKKINMDWLFTETKVDQLAKEHQLKPMQITRTIKRGQALIKSYLVNNDVISDYLFHPSEERIKEKKIINHNPVPETDYGKIKYIRAFFPFLTTNDIAVLLNTSSYLIVTLLDYPTVAYLKAAKDDSIKEKVLKYCKKKYPNQLPGPVITSKEGKTIA